VAVRCVERNGTLITFPHLPRTVHLIMNWEIGPRRKEPKIRYTPCASDPS
jgi:hypothetical protein